jgi:hypothetical protein
MPQQRWSPLRERQYEHIKEGLEDRGRSEDTAKEIAARTVNKERARAGESRQASRTSTHDISSSRRGGLRSHRGPGGAHRRAAAQRGAAPWPARLLAHAQGRAGAAAGPLRWSGWPARVEAANSLRASSGEVRDHRGAWLTRGRG